MDYNEYKALKEMADKAKDAADITNELNLQDTEMMINGEIVNITMNTIEIEYNGKYACVSAPHNNDLAPAWETPFYEALKKIGVLEENFPVNEFVNASDIIESMSMHLHDQGVPNEMIEEYLNELDFSMDDDINEINKDWAALVKYDLFSGKGTIDEQFNNMGFYIYTKANTSVLDTLKQNGLIPEDFPESGVVNVDFYTDDYKGSFNHEPNLFFGEKVGRGVVNFENLNLLKLSIEAPGHDTVDLYLQQRVVSRYDDYAEETDVDIETKILSKEQLTSLGHDIELANRSSRTHIENVNGMHQVQFRKLPPSITKEYAAVKLQDEIAKHLSYSTGSITDGKLCISDKEVSKEMLEAVIQDANAIIDRDSQLLTPKGSEQFMEFDDMVESIEREDRVMAERQQDRGPKDRGRNRNASR